MTNPRLSRLRRDYEKVQELAARSPFVSILATEGNPPEKYLLHLTCKGITSVSGDQPVYSESHRLEILLPQEYPRKGPAFRMATPIFHPNIAGNGTVCIGDEGDHGYAPGMPLDDLIVRVMNIIRYENVGLGSVYNGFARDWARRNERLLPIDRRPILLEELEINILDDDLDIVIVG